MFCCNQCPKTFDDHSAIRRHLSIKHFNYFPYICKICKKAGENHTTATEEDMDKHITAIHQASDYNIILSRNKVIESKINAVIDECRLSTSHSTSRDFKNNLHNGSNALNDQSLSHEFVTDSGSNLPHVAQEQNNGKTIENIATDDIEIVFESAPQKIKNEVTAPKNISLDCKNALRQVYNVLCDETTVDISAKEIDRSSSEMNQELSNNEATGNICADENDDFHSKIIEKVTVQRESSINLLENSVPELQSLRGTPIMSNDTHSQVQLNSAAVSDETFNQIDEENIRHDSTPNDQSTAVPLLPVEENVFPHEETVDKEFSEHVSIEPAIQTRLRSSSSNFAAKLIQRTLPMNDRHSRTKLSSNCPNPMKTNGTKKLHKCDQCSYACTQKGNLDKHMRTHTGNKPFKCGHCSFACTQKSTLSIHVRNHTGEKPYKCDQCSYASGQKVNLDKHVRTHTGNKPFKCGYCKYACADKSTLNIHVRTHTGEKPYKCDVCPYACAYSSALKNHILTHTGEKPYKCSECAYAAIQSVQLREHVRHHHSKKME